mmetsp:Transcript_56394/g.167850  ORF Transcript_56394/g.167850 Transcript_56394/m.167850 type:complete len:286 (+) Transcript_56394:532-1389(+)
MGNMRLRGTKRLRSSVKGEWSENARLTCGNSSVSFRMPGTTPTVETFILLVDRPIISGDVSTRRASKTRGFPNGSPMPIRETLSTFWPCCMKCSAWSAISSASSWRLRPIFPVAQKAHWKAQPTWDEMQSDLCDLNSRETASTLASSLKDRSSTFCAASPCCVSPLAKLLMYFPKRSFNLHFRPLGRPSILCHRRWWDLYTPWRTCLNRHSGSPSELKNSARATQRGLAASAPDTAIVRWEAPLHVTPWGAGGLRLPPCHGAGHAVIHCGGGGCKAVQCPGPHGT